MVRSWPSATLGARIACGGKNHRRFTDFNRYSLGGHSTADEMNRSRVRCQCRYLRIENSSPTRQNGRPAGRDKSGRRVVMKRQIPTQAKDAPKPSDAILAKRYLELQRLRDEVRKAEISRAVDAPYSKDQTGPPYRAPNTA